MADLSPDELRSLEAVRDRLVDRFAPVLPREVIEETVADTSARLLEQARLTTFVPLLTEREARRRLVDLVSSRAA